jgi:hypothetical protein
VQLFPANQLGSPPEQLEQTKLGVIEMNLPTQGALTNMKGIATVMTPFAYRDYATPTRFLMAPSWIGCPEAGTAGLIICPTGNNGSSYATNSSNRSQAGRTWQA